MIDEQLVSWICRMKNKTTNKEKHEIIKKSIKLDYL